MEIKKTKTQEPDYRYHHARCISDGKYCILLYRLQLRTAPNQVGYHSSSNLRTAVSDFTATRI